MRWADEKATELKRLSYVDELTGLYNRRYFAKVLQQYTHTTPDSLVIESALGLCRELQGTKSLAEGIETLEQLERLKASGCNCGQGYYFSKPISHQAFEEFLQR